MSLKTKIESAQKELKIETPKRELKSGKFRKLTIVERCGRWTIGWVVFVSILVGSSWTAVYYEYKNFSQEFLTTRSITIVNEIVPAAKADEIVAIPKIETNESVETIAKKIYQLESSSGTNGTDQGCIAKGLVNGYGYIPGSCYKNHDEVTKLVQNWIVKHQKQGLSEAEMLCLYNVGTVTNDCTYYQNYLSIN